MNVNLLNYYQLKRAPFKILDASLYKFIVYWQIIQIIKQKKKL